MARCGCSSGTCSCSIVAGDGIVITGAGSSSNPFVVNGPAFDVADSATVDLSISGDGTVTTPYTISATVNMALDQLTDVNASAPVAGYLLTYQTSPAPGWYAAVATSGTPGATLHDGSLIGDGTASNVLGVKIDPAGGITTTGSGLFAPTYEITCLSTTRPTTPTDRMRIYETDTKASGWYDLSAGRWIMTDSVPQSYTPVFSSTANNTNLGNGTLVGFYWRAGMMCNFGFQMATGTTTNFGWDSNSWSLPFTARGAPGVTHHWHSGAAHLQPGGWYTFNGIVTIIQGEKRCFIYAPANLENSDVHFVRNAVGNSNTGNSVPQRLGMHTWQPGSFIEASGSYMMKDGVT